MVSTSRFPACWAPSSATPKAEAFGVATFGRPWAFFSNPGTWVRVGGAALKESILRSSYHPSKSIMLSNHHMYSVLLPKPQDFAKPGSQKYAITERTGTRTATRRSVTSRSPPGSGSPLLPGRSLTFNCRGPPGLPGGGGEPPSRNLRPWLCGKRRCVLFVCGSTGNAVF